jgi:hypothetical protein
MTIALTAAMEVMKVTCGDAVRELVIVRGSLLERVFVHEIFDDILALVKGVHTAVGDMLVDCEVLEGVDTLLADLVMLKEELTTAGKVGVGSSEHPSALL